MKATMSSVFLVTLLISSIVHASSIDFFTGNSNTDVANVLLNQDNVSYDTVSGTINNGSDVVYFQSNEAISADPNGQAKIEAGDGSFNYLKIYMMDSYLGFDKIVFNVNGKNITDDAKKDQLTIGTVKLKGTDQNNVTYEEYFDLDINGENYFTGMGLEDTYFKFLEITTTVGDIEIADVRQVRIGAGQSTTPPSVPEPATMLLFGTGLVGLAGIARRKVQ